MVVALCVDSILISVCLPCPEQHWSNRHQKLVYTFTFVVFARRIQCFSYNLPVFSLLVFIVIEGGSFHCLYIG